MHEVYKKAVRLAAKYGITNLSNYLLYNTDNDTPEELYKRLELNVELCEELGISIYSFPMKYHPIDDPNFFDNRDFIGKSWNRKYIRAIQAVLNSTHGKIGRGKNFFHAAFGENVEQFKEILIMPETFIIERYKYDIKAHKKYLKNGGKSKLKIEDTDEFNHLAGEWRKKYNKLTPIQREQALEIIHGNVFSEEIFSNMNKKVLEVLQYYLIKREEK
ncbi:MAG: hypothetical protein FWG64_06635 [Firmicutes bacterium]|nr:hypothetical protein [Bacillota bacterium]